jgi:biotin synthase
VTTADLQSAIQRVKAAGADLSASVELADVALLLNALTPEQTETLHRAAYEVKAREVGKVVYFRGLVELGNLCVRDCVYCGIRRDNTSIERFTLDIQEIIAGAKLAHEYGYGSLVLQGGEREDEGHIDFITEALEKIHEATGGELAITLSLGEQTRAVYRRWREAGAHRYLLRIETTDHNLYAELHPDRTNWETRRRCLDHLRDEGYHVGTGVMIGLPGQSIEQMARDVLFFREQDVDMIGMGPYIPHDDTPLGHRFKGFDAGRQLRLGLNMIACARLLLPDANIAATTALQALDPHGRERGLMAGANVIMPNVTDTRHHASYQLYNGKPGLQENAPDIRRNLEAEIEALGETVGYGVHGDAPRAVKRGLATG